MIRHGQASLGAADYDVLSPLGEQQAGVLGRHLARMLEPPQAIYNGPRKRQRDTARLLVAAAREDGAAFPDPIELPEFDEYPALELMRQALPGLLERHPELRALHDAWKAAHGTPEHPRAFERTFQRAMRHWLEGQVDHPEIEAHAAFQGRVERGLQAVMDRHPRRSTVLVVSSAGPVGAAVRLALGLDGWAGLQASFVVHNASFTEFAYRPGELQLRSFNALPAFAERGHVTLR